MTELQKKLEFAENLVIDSYDKVQEYLDDLAVNTAKETAEGFVELFEPLGTKT